MVAFSARSRARDGLKAILRARARTCSTLLFDYQLPGKDGVDVLTWVRHNVAARRAVRVYSGERLDFLQNRVGSLGVRATLLDPLSAHDLIGALPASTAAF